MNLSSEEVRLILSALEGNRIGTWGDKRHIAIEKLIKKIKRERGKA